MEFKEWCKNIKELEQFERDDIQLEAIKNDD